MKLLLALFCFSVFSFGMATKVEKCNPKTPAADAVKVESGDLVTVHYTGWLFDKKGKDHKGKEFDSSKKEGRTPFSVTIGSHQVIEGWDKGIVGLAKGQKCTLTIPPKEGYGERGAPGAIPPNSTLIFDVEVLDVKKPGKS